MKQPVLLLIFDETSKAFQQIEHTLQEDFAGFSYLTVASKESFLKALEKHPAIVLADYDLLQFSACELLETLIQKDIQIPVIVVSGTPGTKPVVQVMKLGAANYILKDDLADLSDLIHQTVNIAPVGEFQNKPYNLTPEIANRYYNLFEESPIALWETDFSAAKRYIDDLIKNGVDDLEVFLDENPAVVLEISKRRKILSINQTTVKMYHAKDKQEAIEKLGMTFSEASLALFKKQILWLYSGQTEISGEVEHKTLDGETIYVSFKESVAAGYEETWGKVYTTLLDITPLKVAEEEKKQTESLLRTIIDTSPDWIFLKDEDHRYRLVNKTFADGIQLPPEEIIGKTGSQIGLLDYNVIDHVSIEHKGFVDSDDPIFKNNEENRTYGVEIFHQNGNSWIFDSIKVPMPVMEDGKKLLLGIARDISEHHHMEQALKDSEERYRYLYQTIPDAVFILDESGKIIEVNQVLCDLIGYEEDEVLNKTHRLFDKSNTEPVGKRLAHIKSEGFDHFEASIKTKSGQRLEVSITAKRIEYNGKPAIINIARDITSRIIAEECLREDEELLQQVMNENPSAIWVIDEDGRYRLVNKTAATFFQLHSQEIIGMTNEDLAKRKRITKDEADRFYLNTLHVIKTKSSLFISEQTFTDIDGIVHWMQVRLIPLNETGEVQMVLGIATEITEKRKAHKALQVVR